MGCARGLAEDRVNANCRDCDKKFPALPHEAYCQICILRHYGACMLWVEAVRAYLGLDEINEAQTKRTLGRLRRA